MKLELNVFGDNERAKSQNEDRLNGGYGGDYFDENEHRAGQEKYDLATGNPYKNDGDIEAPEVNIVYENELEDPLVLEFDKEVDSTEKWLLENDPRYLGKGKWKEDKAA